MPDKQKDSKIMSMLERKGIIRRSGNDSKEASTDEKSDVYSSDIKPIFDQSDEAKTVKTAAKQPVPGMPTPVFQSEKTTAPMTDKQKEKALEALKSDAPPVTIETPPAPAPVAVAPKETAPPPAPLPVPTPASPVQEPPKHSSPFGGLFRNGNSTPETPTVEQVLREEQQRPDNYTDRYLNVNELYEALALRSKKTDTIYLIEEYLQTLPDSLPDSQRRDIVGKLLSASGFDFDLLMGDGVLRVKMLKEYAERFARHTDDYIAARQSELDELDQQILRTRRLIENRKELHKKQFFTIEAEAQRLKEILTFVSG